MELIEVVVKDSESNLDYTLKVREDRLKEFITRLPLLPGDGRLKHSWANGFRGTAVLGLSTIFNYIPIKFPIVDLFNFLLREAKKEGIVCTLSNVEDTLAAFAGEFPTIDGDGNDVY